MNTDTLRAAEVSRIILAVSAARFFCASGMFNESTAYAPRLATQQPYSACRECSNHNWKSFPKENELFRNVRELAELVFGRYNTGYPFGIGIVKLRNFGQPEQEVCLVAASGVELDKQKQQANNLTAAKEATEGVRSDYEKAIENAIEKQCNGKNLILVGHSLGGMVLQRVASLYGRRVLALIDLGSPRVISREEIKFKHYSSFVAIGDDIPSYQAKWDSTGRILADDRSRQCFGPSAMPATESWKIHHFYYPCDHALDGYDVLGTHHGVATLIMERWQAFQAPAATPK